MVQVWRIRAYAEEKTIGAAKPLVLLKGSLALPAGQAQRLL